MIERFIQDILKAHTPNLSRSLKLTISNSFFTNCQLNYQKDCLFGNND